MTSSKTKSKVVRTRRHFLQGAIATGIAGISGISGLGGILLPLRALADKANWPGTLFAISEFDKTLAELTQGAKTQKATLLKAPQIAENGAQVRVSIDATAADIKGIKKISLIVEKNPIPLTSQFVMHEHSIPSVSINLKVRETSRIMALVETNEHLYMDEVEVQVAAGGCG